MLSLFVLFYLYQLGWQMPAVVAYLLFFTLGSSISDYLSSWAIVKAGVLRVFILSNILRVAFAFALFAFSGPGESSYLFLVALALLDALSLRMYYSTWDFYFSDLQSSKRSGKQASMAWMIFALTAALAPMAGGLLAQIWDFKLSIVVAGILLLFSVVPLISIKQTPALKPRPDLLPHLGFGKVWEAFKRVPKGSLGAFVVSIGVYYVFLYLWSLYLAVAIFADKAFAGLGLVLSASAIVALLASWLAGRAFDRGRYRSVLRGSTWIEFLLSGVRIFVVSIPAAALHNLVQQQAMAHNLIACQWYYAEGKQPEKRLPFFRMCNLAQGVAHGLVVATILILLVIFSQAQLEVLKWSCAALGIFSPLMLALSFKKGKGVARADSS